MICRDGFVTAEIGQYLGLAKQDIIGGTDYDSHNDDVTFVNVNLDKSTIDLGNFIFYLYKSLLLRKDKRNKEFSLDSKQKE